MNENIRKLFPALKKYTYLNSAAVAPLSILSIGAVVSQLRDVSENGSSNYTDWVATKDRAREIIAKMLSVRSEQIAFLRNTSDGFATVANGLEWKQGDNIDVHPKTPMANQPAYVACRDRFP